MEIDYKGVSVKTCDDVYEPAEDTFLLMDALESIDIKETDNVLEIGTGTGIIAIYAAKRARHVTAVDINPDAVDCAKMNAKRNNVKCMDVFQSDLFSNAGCRYDLIIFNPPYLPVGEGEATDEMIARAWNGGRSGREITDKFLVQAPSHLTQSGRIVILDSSKSRYQKTVEVLEKCGLDVKIACRMKFFFEELVVIIAKR
ncbi:MAG: HemK2/MTQ2 family protein methyltransferase [archaeon]